MFQSLLNFKCYSRYLVMCKVVVSVLCAVYCTFFNRPGSLIIDFTVFYELPPVDARLLLKKLGYFSSSITSPSGDWKDYLENHFRVLVLEKIRRRVTNASSLWYKTYGTFGVTSGDITLLSTGK